MVAAQRGHRVVLFEKEAQLGGQAWVAARAPNRAEVYGVISYREMMLNRLGVDLRLGLTVGVEHILAESPEVVVLATGALPCEPELSGWPEHVHTTWGLLAGGLNPKRAGYRKAVVIDDGGGFWDTYSAVEYLAEAGLAVTVVTPSACIAGGVPDESKEPLLRRLRIHGVRFIPLAAAAWVEPGELVAYDRIRLQASGDFCEIRIETDVVVVNSGRRVNDSLTERLQDTGIKVHQVGDCLAPRRLSNAVFEAHSLARSL